MILCSRANFKIYMALVMVVFIVSKTNSEEQDFPDMGEMIQSMAESYRNKVPKDLSFIVQFKIVPEQEKWYVIIEKGGNVSVGDGLVEDAVFTFVCDKKTLRLIYEGKLSALTAAGKAKGSDISPLEIEMAEDLEFTPELKQHMFNFLQHFFSKERPERILLGEEYSRLIHGGHAIPLYYYSGFRSAWYMVKKGERMNEPGDTNPFPQAIIIIEGEGMIKIGDETITVKANESYYIPPDSDHVIWTESNKPLVLIWLAWGEGA